MIEDAVTIHDLGCLKRGDPKITGFNTKSWSSMVTGCFGVAPCCPYFCQQPWMVAKSCIANLGWFFSPRNHGMFSIYHLVGFRWPIHGPIKSTAIAAASRASLQAQLLALQVDGPRSHRPVSAKLERPWWVYSALGVDAVGIEEKWDRTRSLPPSGVGLIVS